MRKRKFRLAKNIVNAVIISVALFANIAANRDDVVQAQSHTKITVIAKSQGINQEFHTSQKTVGAALKEIGVDLDSTDKVSPSRNEAVKNNLKITVVKVTEKTETAIEPIPFKTTTDIDTNLKPGQIKEIKAGVPGEMKVEYKVRYEDGKLVKHTPTGVKNVLRQPVTRVVTMGPRKTTATTSRGSHNVRKVMKMRATGYCASSCGKHSNGITAIGLRAKKGVVAVDPRVIPYRTKMYIEGYGMAIAGDCGGAIKGNRIDLCFNSRAEAIRFGRRTVTVQILD